MILFHVIFWYDPIDYIQFNNTFISMYTISNSSEHLKIFLTVNLSVYLYHLNSKEKLFQQVEILVIQSPQAEGNANLSLNGRHDQL